MKNKLRICLYGLVLLILPVYAGDVDYINAGDVFMSAPVYSKQLQLRALFFKPTANNLSYSVQKYSFNGLSSWKVFDINPRYHCGFDIGICGISNWRGLSGGINWQHFSSKSCASRTVQGTDTISPIALVGQDENDYKNALGKVYFSFNEIAMQAGGYVVMGDYTKTHLFGGLNITKLKQLLTATYSNNLDTVFQSTDEPSIFIGAGPCMGADFSYDITKGFYITGQLAAALLMGGVKNSTTYLFQAPNEVDKNHYSVNNQTIVASNRAQMVPAFSQRFGLAYFYSSLQQGVVKIDAGWEGKILLNVLQSTNVSSGAVERKQNVTGLTAQAFTRKSGNFSLGGPYLSLTVSF